MENISWQTWALIFFGLTAGAFVIYLLVKGTGSDGGAPDSTAAYGSSDGSMAITAPIAGEQFWNDDVVDESNDYR